VREDIVSMSFLKLTTFDVYGTAHSMPVTPKFLAEYESGLDFVMEVLDFIMAETVWF
jgi:hypothetical protein